MGKSNKNLERFYSGARPKYRVVGGEHSDRVSAFFRGVQRRISNLGSRVKVPGKWNPFVRKASVEKSIETSIQKSKELPGVVKYAPRRQRVVLAGRSVPKWKRFLQRNRYYIAGACVLVFAVGVGVFFLRGTASVTEEALSSDEGQHVIALKPAVMNQAPGELMLGMNADGSPEGVPPFQVLSFASVKAHAIYVNGRPVAEMQTASDAETVLESLKKQYVGGEGTKVLETAFSERVEIKDDYVDVVSFDGYSTPEDALAYIIRGTKEEKKHTVKKGENYWIIAQYYGVEPHDLEMANPGVKPEAIQIGQEISLVVPKPLVSVRTVEEVTYTDQIPFEVVYENTASLYKGESKTKVNGAYGQRDILAKVVKENGREVTRTVIAEKVVSNPTTKVVYKGTKNPPPKKGSGVLARPSRGGIVTSEFGAWRWGRRHTGIDLGMRSGNSILAADGGVVIVAGYTSYYGKYVIIDHGGNVSTVYAHNSALLVNVGEKVFKGQTIAYSGNTGRSTGPHLHFEVRINGVPKNPRSYVNF